MEEVNVVHKRIGNRFKKAIPIGSGLVLVRDVACGGKQHIPLFRERQKSRRNEYCNVDLLILKGVKVKAIVEIEESNVKPTQICGKFLTSALSKYYIHESEENKPVEMDESVVFIQIVDSSRLKRGKTAKLEQWKRLGESIRSILPLEKSNVRQYVLLTTDELEQLDSIVKDLSSQRAVLSD